MVRTNYCEKYGIMCCIVLKRYYLCVRKEGNTGTYPKFLQSIAMIFKTLKP